MTQTFAKKRFVKNFDFAALAASHGFVVEEGERTFSRAGSEDGFLVTASRRQLQDIGVKSSCTEFCGRFD